jgi:peptide alpha-N-acetyltransferase
VTPIETDDDIVFVAYDGEHYLQGIIDLISVDLSEPYSIFTYRYFINNWPDLCFIALKAAPCGDLAAVDVPGVAPKQCVVGTIVCKQDRHRSGALRGYIAMLAVHHSVRKRGMGSRLVKLAVRAMRDSGADEAVLETEVTNLGALRLYEGLGFVRDKRLPRCARCADSTRQAFARVPPPHAPSAHSVLPDVLACCVCWSSYYLNGNDAFRLKVWFNDIASDEQAAKQPADGADAGEGEPPPTDVQ